jgi:pimeloyl-ACP methyl ester carboxylesterase
MGQPEPVIAWPAMLRRAVRDTVLGAAAIAVIWALLIPPAIAQNARPSARPQRPLILVPGLLGSRLCRPDPADPSKTQVVWGTLAALRQFPTIRLSNDRGATDPIKPCGILREIVFLGLYTQDFYAPAIRHLEQIGYREGRELFIFDYDWRRSIFDNAVVLDRFVREKAPDGQVDILGHSMGALVARIYAMHSGSDKVARLFSAGAPFYGSVKVYQTVEKGWGALNPAMGGLDGFRRTMLSFPSVFELMPRYNGCCDGGGLVAFNPASGEAWKGLHWAGVDPSTMPNLPDVFTRIRLLESLIAMPLPKGIEDVLMVGVDQRTPQRAAFEADGGSTALRVQTSWAGDATVIRDSALLGQLPSYPTSFATHERIRSRIS